MKSEIEKQFNETWDARQRVIRMIQNLRIFNSKRTEKTCRSRPPCKNEHLST
jgi:hypothetical protein